MTKKNLKTLVPYHQNTHRSRYELIYLLQLYRTYRKREAARVC